MEKLYVKAFEVSNINGASILSAAPDALFRLKSRVTYGSTEI